MLIPSDQEGSILKVYHVIKEVTAGSLTERVMPSLIRRLESEGNFLTPEQQNGLRAIPATIEAMARGEAGQNFYLSALPMGMGKTTALAETTRAMLDDASYADVGILILVNQLNLIVPLVERMGLALDDPRFAVRVAKDDMIRNKRPTDLNKLGIAAQRDARTTKQKRKTIDGEPNPDYVPPPHLRAQVLITSQQGFVRAAWERGNFDFWQHCDLGGTCVRRSVIVWDEAIAPIAPITITIKQIKDYAGVLFSNGRPLAANNLMRWVIQLEHAIGEVSTVPQWSEVNELLNMEWDQLPDRENEPEWGAVGWALKMLQGHQVSVHADTYSGPVAISYIELLPKEFAPVLICDAFGSDRHFYRAWAEHRQNFEFLPDAPKTYHNLTIHWRLIAAGKVAHRTPMQRERIINAAIDAHFLAGAPILNIKHKMDKLSYDIERDIRKGIEAKGGNPNRDAFLTWGLHTGTNAFLDLKHEFVGGLWRKPLHVYKALFRGVSQLSPHEPLDDDQLTMLALTEVAHDLQQAAGRIAVRQNVNGDCPEGCHLWITSSDQGNMPFTRSHFERAFPGAVILPWPHAPTLRKGGKIKTDNRARLFNKLRERKGEWFEAGSFDGLSKQMVARYLDRDTAFREFLVAQGYVVETKDGEKRRGGRVKLYRLVTSMAVAA